jgi:hypothetical protein
MSLIPHSNSPPLANSLPVFAVKAPCFRFLATVSAADFPITTYFFTAGSLFHATSHKRVQDAQQLVFTKFAELQSAIAPERETDASCPLRGCSRFSHCREAESSRATRRPAGDAMCPRNRRRRRCFPLEDQKLALLAQPLPQPRPSAQKGFVRDLGNDASAHGFEKAGAARTWPRSSVKTSASSVTAVLAQTRSSTPKALSSAVHPRRG